MRSIVDEEILPAPTGRMPDEPAPAAAGTGVPGAGTNPADSSDPLDEEAVSAEEQEFYDIFVAKALQFIHGPKSSRQVLKHLNQSDLSVPEAVGRTTAMIAKNIIQSAQQAGQQVSPDAAFGAAQEVVEEVLEVGVRAGILPVDWPIEDTEELTPEQEKLAQDSFAFAAQFYGNDMLQDGSGQALQGEAQNEVLRQIQGEAKAGTLSPDFMVTDGNTVEGGVKRAIMANQQRGQREIA